MDSSGKRVWYRLWFRIRAGVYERGGPEMKRSTQFRLLLVGSWIWIAIIMGVVSKWDFALWAKMTIEASVLSTLFMSGLRLLLPK